MFRQYYIYRVLLYRLEKCASLCCVRALLCFNNGVFSIFHVPFRDTRTLDRKYSRFPSFYRPYRLKETTSIVFFPS